MLCPATPLFSCLDAFQAQEQPLRSCKLPAAQPNAQLLIQRPNKGITSDRLEIEKMADKMLVVDYQPQGSLQALADRLTDDL